MHYMPWYVAWAPTPSNGRLGEVYIGPYSKIAVGEKLQFSTAHRTAHCSMSGAPSRCSVRAGDRWRRMLFTPDSPVLTLDSPVVFSPSATWN
jgi:hypothetical protein